MITFITSVRHPNNSIFYERVWDLLRDTLFSVCSQTCPDFKVIVVCNKILDKFEDNHRIHGKVDFVTVDFPPPSLAQGAITGVPACNLDRGLKFVVGLIAAKKYDPEYVMFFDADDFIADSISDFCSKNPGRMGWYFDYGMYTQNGFITYRNNFNETCGTSHILNYSVLCKDIPFKDLDVDATPADILKFVHPFFVKGVLGCHMNYGVFFFNCHQPIEKYPLNDTAVYNMGTGENHSGKLSKCGPGWIDMRRKATRKLDRSVYRMKFPCINHKHRVIPVHVKDDRCSNIFSDLGIYHLAELSAKEIFSIYGRDTCSEYNSIAFVVNPFERLVYDYYKDYNKSLISGESFSDYIRRDNIKRQSPHIPPWIKNIIRIEDAYSDPSCLSDIFNDPQITQPQKVYYGHYSDYYSDADVDFVYQNFQKDLDLGGYSFERASSEESVLPIPDIATDTIPNVLHFCYGMKLTSQKFSFVNYLAILSAVTHNKPEAVYFHYCVEPHGVWWDAIKPYLTLHKVELVNEIFGNRVEHYAHASDIIRLRELYRTGGIYLDIDTITWKPFTELLSNECVLGIQDSARIFQDPTLSNILDAYGLCNAVMLCKPGSTFIRDWYYCYSNFSSSGRDSDWDYHSVIYPYLLYKRESRKDVTVLSGNSFFFPIWDKLQELTLSDGSFEKHVEKFKDSYCTHLWDNDPTVDTSVITPHYIRTSDSVYANSIRTHVFKALTDTMCSISLVFLTHNRLAKTKDCMVTWLELSEHRGDIQEVLIYDNASNSKFREWLCFVEERFSKVRVIYSDSNDGVAGGRAVLFEEARGDIVVSVDSDSYIRRSSFLDKAKFVLSDTNIGMCGVVGAFFQNYSTFEHTDIFDGDGEGFVDTLAGCCQIFRRSLYGSVFEMDLNFKPFWLEDTDLCLQLKHNGYKILRINSEGGFEHEWGGTGNILFPDSFSEKQKYFNTKWTHEGNLI